jgi:hypothetical protein
MLRSYSNHRSWSATCSAVNVSPKATDMTVVNSSLSWSVIGRMAMSMAPLYRKRLRRTPAFLVISSSA